VAESRVAIPEPGGGCSVEVFDTKTTKGHEEHKGALRALKRPATPLGVLLARFARPS